MKTIKRELAHVGMFGPDGVKISRKHLADCQETFDGKCPATLGHRLADWMPKFGNVQAVELQKGGDSLVGDVEVNDLLADAVDAKFYEDVSVGIQSRKADGKFYLHHLAFLGAVPPKIRDLKVFSDLGIVYCGDEEPVLMFAEASSSASGAGDSPQDVADALRRIADKGRAGWAFEDVTKALAELSALATEMLINGAKIPDSLKEPMQGFADQLAKSGRAGKEEDVATKEELDAKDAELAQARKDLADSKTTILASAKDGLKAAMKGRIPMAKQPLVLALADQLGEGEGIELADEADPSVKTKVSGLEILRRVLESIAKPVTEGREQLGDDGESAAAKAVDLSKFAGKI